MKTLVNSRREKVRNVEVKMSNMTFVVEARCHYMAALMNPGWSTVKYTAKIKETGEGIGRIGGVKLIKNQMALIDSIPDLFLR
jgi:hypothetical protein